MQPPRQNLTLIIDPGLNIAPVSAVAIFEKKCFPAPRSTDVSDSPKYPKSHLKATTPAQTVIPKWKRAAEGGVLVGVP